MLALVLAVLLPALAVGSYATWQAVRTAEAAAEARLLDTAAALALAVDRELGGQLAVLTGFATSPAFGAGPQSLDLAALDAHARRIVAALGTHLSVLRRDGTRIVATGLPPGTPLPPSRVPETIELVFATGKPVVTGLVTAGTITRAPVFSLSLPVRDAADGVAYVAMAAFRVEHLRDLLRAQGLPEGTFASIVDAGDTIVARSDALHRHLVGQPAAAAAVAHYTNRASGIFRATTLDGVDRMIAFRSLSAAPGWRVFVGEPLSGLAAAWRGPVVALAAGGAVTLLLGSALALLSARGVLRPLRRLDSHAAALATAGGGVRAADIPPARVRELEVLRRGFAEAEAAVARREAGQAASERRLRAVLESTADGVLSLGPDWGMTFLNGHAARMIAQGRDVLGLNLWEAFPDAVGSTFWLAFRRCMDERIPAEAEAHYPPLGRIFATRAFPAEDGGITVFFQDVTDRHEAEARLRESEERLRLALDAGRMGIAAWDLATDRLDWDARQYALFGIDPVAGGMTGAQALSRIHLEDRPGLKAAVRAAIAAGQGRFNYEFRLLLAGGRARWITGYGQVLPGPDGQAARIVSLNFDTTAAHNAEADLARSHEAARAAAERVQLALSAGAILGTWDWELPTDRFAVDERFAEAFGIEPEAGRIDLPLETVIAAVHPDDMAGLRTAIAEVIARGGPYSHEYRVRGRDGLYRWIQANGRVDHGPDGTPLRFPGVLLDIGARRALEAERDRAAGLLRAFTDAVPGVVYAKDREGRMLVANHGATALIGKPSSFYLGRTDAEFLDDTAQAASVMANDRRVMDSGVAEQVEETISPPDGTPTVWLSTKAPFRDADGQVIGLIGASVDITARKEAEAILARSNEDLERLVEARTAELRASELRLAEAARMEALGRLAGGIAHDFNNVLQAVQGGVALASKRLTRDPDAARHLLSLAVDATERGAAVTGRLLAFARRGELSASAVAPAPLLEGLAQILHHTLGPSVTLAIEADAAMPALWADAAQLEAVLINLANNARDALPGGNGAVILRAEPVTVGRSDAPAGLLPGGYIRLSVVDDGEGMPPEILARVTEPFFTTRPRGKGTGLGLAMARGFAEQSGGALVIESVRGHGTTVALWIPCAPEDMATKKSMEASREALREALPAAEPQGAAVMLVDDEPGVRATLAAALTDQGHAVTEAEDALAALAKLDLGIAVEVLVTDLAMPGGMDGLALLREVRLRRPGLPALLITGHTGDAAWNALQEAVGTGPFAMLRKPASAEAISAQLAALLHAGGSPQGKPGSAGLGC
ncbi:MAG: PAS domain S-box protein [Acetobacteraceae bacterium]|nr:MAG: PAS domain S-box protein [Acetobacteraceae bacterium]